VPIEIREGRALLDSVAVYYWVGNPKVASMRFNVGQLISIAQGSTMVYASATVGGEKWIDSVQYTVGGPAR
jgi:hypothetical protein